VKGRHEDVREAPGGLALAGGAPFREGGGVPVLVPEGQQEQQAGRIARAQQGGEQVDAVQIRPLQIVDPEDDRAPIAQPR
jgi:hypothetical protein